MSALGQKRTSPEWLLYIFFELLLQKVVGFDEPVGKAR
jgi:hypothetical protein